MVFIDDQNLNVYFLLICGKPLNILILVCFVLGILRPTKSHFVACTSNHRILIVMVGVVVQSLLRLLFSQVIMWMKYKSLVFFLKVLAYVVSIIIKLSFIVSFNFNFWCMQVILVVILYFCLSMLSRCNVSISAQVFLLILF